MTISIESIRAKYFVLRNFYAHLPINGQTHPCEHIPYVLWIWTFCEVDRQFRGRQTHHSLDDELDMDDEECSSARADGRTSQANNHLERKQNEATRLPAFRLFLSRMTIECGIFL